VDVENYSPQEIIANNPTIAYEHNIYNLQNRLARLEKYDTTHTLTDAVEYKYNDAGIRVQKIEDPDGAAEVTTYLVDSYNHTGYAQTLEEDGPAGLKTYTIGDDILSEAVDSGTAKHLLYDGHGSTRQLVSGSVGSTTIHDDFSYDGYGVLLQQESVAQNDPGKVAQQQTSLLYAGEHFDVDSQNYYLRARWYDSSNGRFNRTDPFSGDTQDPQSLHKYLYCHANPVNGLDPSGMMTLGQVLIRVSLLGALIGLNLGGIAGGSQGAIRGMLTGAALAPLLALAIILGGGSVIAPLLGVNAATGIFITHTAVTAIFVALGLRQFSKSESGRAKAAVLVAVVIIVAFWAFSAYAFYKGSLPARLPQDKNVDPTPPPVKETNRPIGTSSTQNARLQQDIGTLKAMGADNFRVNQHQVNVKNVRVGINRPDCQFTLNNKRFYLEYETTGSTRGPVHAARIQANDPKSTVIVIEQD
jgi:RHS repeat-associated protein